MGKATKGGRAASDGAGRERAGGAGAPGMGAAPTGSRQAGAATAPTTGGHQLRMTVLFVIMLAALVAVGFLFRELFAEDPTVAEAQTLLDVSADEVVGLAWTSGDQTVELELSNDTWKDAGEPDAELDQSDVEDIVAAIAGLEVERTVAAEDVTSEMGRDDPTAQATLELSDGTAIEVTLGASTADGSGSYVWVERSDASGDAVDGSGEGADGSDGAADGSDGGAGDAYIVDGTLASAFALTVADLYEQEEGPQVETSDVDSLALTRSDGTLTLNHRPEGSDTSYTDDYTWFADDGNGEQAADSTSAQTLVGLVNDVAWASCVDATYEEADAATYGFDVPTLTATLTYTVEEDEEAGEDSDGAEDVDADDATEEDAAAQQTYVLVVGAQAEDGSYYAQPQGSDRVYTLSSSTVEKLLAATAVDLAPDDVILMDWDTVDSIDVTYAGQTRTIVISRATDDGGEEETTYTVDGVEVLPREIENLTDALDALEAEGEATDSLPEGSAAEISFTFHRSTETYADMTLSLIPYDNSFYLVSFNGQERLLINKNDVADLISLYVGIEADQDDGQEVADQDDGAAAAAGGEGAA